MLTFESGNPLASAIIHIVDGLLHFHRRNTTGLSNAQMAEEYAAFSEDKSYRTIHVRSIVEGQIGGLEPLSINVPVASELEWNGSQGGPHAQFAVFGVRDESLGWVANFNALNIPGYSTLQQAADDYAADAACENREPHDIEVRVAGANGSWGDWSTFSIVPTEL